MALHRAFFFAAVIALATAFLPPFARELQDSSAAKAACIPGPIGQCTDDFFAQFGLTDPHNETVFEAAVNDYLAKHGVAGWTDIRTWVRTLQNCSFGADNLNACLQWQELMNDFNFTKEMAMKWQVEFLTLEYETGPGFDVLTHNWFCIVQVGMHEDAVIQQCRNHFNDQEHNDPNNTCQHLAEYLYCIERPYARNCGREVGALVCHIERIAYQVYRPDCASTVALHCGGGPELK